MKMRIRIMGFFTGLLFLFILFVGFYNAFFAAFVFDKLENDAIIVMIVFSSFIFGGMLVGFSFVRPLLLMLSIISNLTAGQYELAGCLTPVYKRNGRLKIKYSLYKELISDLYVLGESLQNAENQRIKLDEAKTNWLAGVSHDLKTPLSYVTGYSALLLNKAYSWSAEETHHFLAQIYDKSIYIEELLREFNQSFAAEAPELPLTPETFDLVEFLRNLIADTANMPHADQYLIEYLTTETHLWITADRKRLYRVFQNLLVNAVRHNPYGTDICVELKRLGAGQAAVSVSDTGIGMEWPPKHEAERQGRGLSVVESIVTAHRGRFTIQSTPSQGTVCTVVLRLTT